MNEVLWVVCRDLVGETETTEFHSCAETLRYLDPVLPIPFPLLLMRCSLALLTVNFTIPVHFMITIFPLLGRQHKKFDHKARRAQLAAILILKNDF